MSSDYTTVRSRSGHSVVQLVEALCYNSDGVTGIFLIDNPSGSTMAP